MKDIVDFLDLKVLKGAVSVISSDPLCKDYNDRFTTLPFKAFSDQELDINVFVTLYFHLRVLCESDLRISRL